MHDYATCGGPRYCEYCRAILTETPEQSEMRMTAENRERLDTPELPRDANGIPNPYAAVLHPIVVTDTNGIPDPYASALLRREVQPVLTDGIPDPYATALARRASR